MKIAYVMKLHHIFIFSHGSEVESSHTEEIFTPWDKE